MRRFGLCAVLFVLGASLGASGGVAAEAVNQAQGPVTQIGVGAGGGTVFGAMFLPHAVTVPVGTTITWTNQEDWGHQVTFFGTGAEAPQGSPRTWQATVPPGTTAQYDGTGLVHSGVLAHAQQISVTFTSEGTFPYECPI